MIYEIWETLSGNLVGSYDREEDALALLRRAIAAHGLSYVNTMVLAAEDADGESQTIAEGQDLAKLALSSAASA